VYISPQALVIRQVVTVVVGILVNHDLVGVPELVPAIRHVRIRYREVRAVEPETRRTAAHQPEDVPRPETQREVAVLPGTLQMKSRIVPAGVMSNPLLAINVRRLGVTGAVGEMALGLWSSCRRPHLIMHRRRAAAGRLGRSEVAFGFLFTAASFLLRQRWSSHDGNRDYE